MSLSHGQAEWLVDFMRHLPGIAPSQGNDPVQGGIAHYGQQAFYTDPRGDEGQMQQPQMDYDLYGDY